MRHGEHRGRTGAAVNALAGITFASSRGAAAPLPLSAALLQGLAPDGGLYLPASWPRFCVSPTLSMLRTTATSAGFRL